MIRRRSLSRPATSLLCVGLLLAAGVAASGAAGQPEPPDGTAGPAATQRLAPVARANAVCPEPLWAQGARTDVAVAAPGLAGSRQRSGRASLSPLGTSGEPLATVDGNAPRAAAATAADRSPPLVGSATGGTAPGFTGGMTTLVPSGDLRGLAATTCVAAGTDFWFVGSGAEVGQRGRLYLTNPEAAPAEVDVTLYGPAGEIVAPAGRGVAVAAGEQEVLLLDALAPAIPRFGVHVEVRSGRIGAALRDQQLRGLDPLGVDWVPAAARPARRVVVPGVPSGEGERRLQVLAPGERGAIVRVRLLAADGSFVPAGADVVEVAAGTVADIDLAPHARGQAVAVELESDTPVTAGLLARVGGGRSQAELAYTAAATAVGDARPAVVVPATAPGTTSTLLLAAPDTAADVVVTPLPPSTGTPTTVSVPAGAQVALDLQTLDGGPPAAVTVAPERGSGPVFVARSVAATDPRGPLVSVVPVHPGRSQVRVPGVVADLTAGVGG